MATPSHAGLKRNYAKGIGYGLIGGIVLSFDVALIRLAGSDPWLIMALRGAVLALIFLVIHLFYRPVSSPERPLESTYWLVVAVLYGINNVFFTLGVFYTSTANLVFILAFNPMIAAVLSWWLVGEKPRPVTWAAIGITTIGVAIIVVSSVETGNGWGDFFSLCCAATLALALTLTRKSGQDLSLAPGFGGAVSACFALPIALAWSPSPESWSWAFANAAILVPVAAFCLAIAPLYIPAPQAAMFYLLESVLAPLWVFLVFGERVTLETLIGGTLVLTALTGHSLWQLQRQKREGI